MALQGFVESDYLAAKLAALKADSATATDWATKTTTDLEGFLDNLDFTPESHYQAYGWAEGLAPNDLFNAAEYKLAKATQMFNDGFTAGNTPYGSVAKALEAFEEAWPYDPYLHYLEYGSAEGINPSNDFDESEYLASKLADLKADSETATEWADKTVDDVKAAFVANGLSALGHYQMFGKKEGIAVTEVPADEKVADDGGVEVPGETFTLTAGTDIVNGTDGDDLIIGDYEFNTTSSKYDIPTLGSFDEIDGGDGTDTLRVNILEPGTSYTLPGATVKNVEKLVVKNDSGNVTADVSGFEGIESVAVAHGTTGNSTITTKGNATSVSVTKGATIGIKDSATTDTLNTVTLTGATGVATITSDALSTLNVSDTNQNVIVAAAAGTRELHLTVDEVTAGTVADAQATSLKVTATGEDSVLTGLTAAKAKTLTFDGDAEVDAGTLTMAALTSISSTNTAGVTIGSALGTGVAFTGGEGDDEIEIGATTKAIDMDAGDDRVLITTGVTALGTGGSIDGGAGEDVLALAADDAATVSAGTTFETKFSNFEVIELAVAATGAKTVNLANLNDISKVFLSADVANALTINNMASGGTLAMDITQSSTTAVSVKDAATSDTDELNILIEGAAAVTSNALTVANVETINYLTDDTAATPTGIDHVSNLTATSAETIKVTGDAGLNLTNTDTTITLFDASGVTDGDITWTTGALADEATIKGGAADNTIVATAATDVVNYTGSDEGVDTIDINNAQNNVISTGGGNDVIRVGTGANTIDAGDGDNTINIDGASAGVNEITLGTGDNTIAFTTAAQSAAGYYDSVTGVDDGETFDWSDAAIINDAGGMATGNFGDKVTLGGAVNFANYLDAAAAGTTGGTDSIMKWFELGGNTYIVVDNSNAATFQDGADCVIELVGTYDLSEAQLGGDGTLVI